MPPFRCWADLPPELLCCVGDRLGLKWYASARGACAAWRRALAPPSPALLVAADNNFRWFLYAASLPRRSSFELASIRSGVRCIGSSNGWLALCVAPCKDQIIFVLLNPLDAVEVVLPPLTNEKGWWVWKVVFAPGPTKEDFVAAAICDVDRIAYVTAGARRWAIMAPVRLAPSDQLTDVVYTDNGMVYCLTKCGDVHLLRLPERRRREEPAFNNTADEADPAEPKFSVLLPPPVKIKGDLHFTNPSRRDKILIVGPGTAYSSTYNQYYMARSQGPHMNAPATMEPLLSEASVPFNPANVFAPPYDTVSAFTTAKNLVLCEGSLYQVWRNKSCSVTLRLPGGGRRRVVENEIIVLRHEPQRQPCWDVVKDLGGYSFFVGCNNAVSMYAEGVPGLRGNCVYWIGGRGRDRGMVFDMASGRSEPYQAPRVGWLAPQHLQRTICWYFLNDVVESSRSSAGRRRVSPAQLELGPVSCEGSGKVLCI